MNRRGVIGIVVVLGILITVGGFAAFVAAGPLPPILGGEERRPPALTSFESAGAHCTDDFMANSSSRVVAGGANTEITYARNVSLSDASQAVGRPTFERLNESTYLLSFPIEETEKAPRDCTAVARYNASMRIPAGDDPWQVIVNHDGQNVTTLYGDSDSSVLGGSASSGGSSSAS